MRLFFAIAIDDRVRAALADIGDALQQRLSRAGAARAVKWVERENLHVTLRFLGEVSDEGAAALVRACERPLAVPPFSLEIGGAGSFPPAGAPRVIWAGVTGGADAARRTFELLDTRLAPLGYEREPRPYAPHLTLGRVREIDRAHGRDLRQWLADVAATLGTVEVSTVTLYRSRLSPNGPRYDMVLQVPLVADGSTGPA